VVSAHRDAERREGVEDVAGDPGVEEDALAVGLVGDGDARGGLDVEAGAEAAQRVGERPGVAARVSVDERGAVVASLENALLEAADVVLDRAGGDGVAAGVDLRLRGAGQRSEKISGEGYVRNKQGIEAWTGE
jgi:hypothetical protein